MHSNVLNSDYTRYNLNVLQEGKQLLKSKSIATKSS